MTSKLSGAHPFFRPFSRLRFLVVFWSLLGSLLTALWHPLGSFWHPSGSYWDPVGTLLAHIGTLLVPFRARFGLFCILGGLLLVRFGRNSFFKAEIYNDPSARPQTEEKYEFAEGATGGTAAAGPQLKQQ